MFGSTLAPKVVFVGDFGAGKSSVVNAITDRDDQAFPLPPVVVPVGDRNLTIIDTEARNVLNVQEHMAHADLVVVIISAEQEKSIQDLEDYWLDQLQDRETKIIGQDQLRPVILVLNKIDTVDDTRRMQLEQQFKNLKQPKYFIFEQVQYVSAYTGEGIDSLKQALIDVLDSVEHHPRWVILDPHRMSMQPAFESALERIFRLIERDGDDVLNYTELAAFNNEVLNEDFPTDEYNEIMRRLNEEGDDLVTSQGLSILGFKHLMCRFAFAKRWARCWQVLHFFHYERDLTLHPRVFPQLPVIEFDQTIELTPHVFHLLELLFNRFADDSLLDDDTRSLTSTMISQNNWRGMRDGGRILTYEAFKEIVQVIPPGHPLLFCPLLDKQIFNKFETVKPNKLTLNGWLSFWAMFAVESPDQCFKQITYLDLSAQTDRSVWFKVTSTKRADRRREEIDRSLVRALLFGGPQCGKTVFCNRLLSRIPVVQYNHTATREFKSAANRIGTSEEYNFLAITEVPAIKEAVEKAIIDLIPRYDMIILMYDLSQSRSFFDLHKIFEAMPKDHDLPIFVLASKADTTRPANQYNQDENDRKYNVEEELEKWRLHPPEEIWLNQSSSVDFPQLFDGLFWVATNPFSRRLKQMAKAPSLPWYVYARRGFVVVVSITTVLYGAYSVYTYFTDSKPNDQPSQRPRYHRRR